MRVTTGLLLTAALLIPGAARAQIGIPRTYDPFGSQPGFPAMPGVSVGPRTPYFPGLPPQVNDMLRNQDVRGMPFGPGGVRRPGSGLPYMPDRVGEPYIPGVPSIDDPLERRFGVRFPPGAVAPYDPTARFREPGGILPPFPTIPDIQSLPRVPLIVPPKFNYKPDLHVMPSLDSSRPAPPLSGEVLGWAAGFLGLVFLIAFGGGFLKGRRRA